MAESKRIVVATVLGVIFGLVCWGFAASGGAELPWFIAVSIILSRTVMGFAIGISGWQINWVLHSIIFGILFSLPGAFGALGTPKDQAMIFVGTIVMGVIYAILIELITSKLFKAPLVKAKA